MNTIGITGGSGFIGKHLTALLKKDGHEIIIFTRSPEKKTNSKQVKYAYWCPEENKCDLTALKDIDAVVHLAGEGIADKRWTNKRKREIAESRILGTQFLVSQLRSYAPKCKTLVSASAIGYYGPDRGNHTFTETDDAYNDFLSKTCVEWEAEAQKADYFLRTVILRFGIVLGKEAGAYHELRRPMNFGIVPILGKGTQVTSWIHADDLGRLLAHAALSDELSGIYNAVAPHPVSHQELMNTIAKHKRAKIRFHVPSILLKILLGEMSQEVLKSCTVSSDKLQHTTFQFQYPKIEDAVREIEAS
jgi:uncharacterized protein (TIGR01777 family)